ncbi:MAG: TIGR03960 family B12-binding radical SAM protein [Clostridiales bacterium]|nr:TIGR03960 family B12-binding radical SAM protein [Clostridiales bacterium]
MMSIRNAMKKKPDITHFLNKVEKPARYIGGEKNSIVKNPDEQDIVFGFAFPDIYEIGMSYVGMQILYNIVNDREGISCERIFAPGTDMEELMRNEDFPLFTLENKIPLTDLDVLGFTLQYEMSFTNILNMLELGGIPLKSKERDETYPLIIAGGPCAFNPEPLADFIDIFVIGDGEESLVCVLDEYRKYKKNGDSKEAFLQFASKSSGLGLYVPKFYNELYKEDGTIKSYEKTYNEANDIIEKAMIQDLDSQDFPMNPIVPLIETVHDRAVVETFRGCTRGCRFCQAGIIYRPIRERAKDTIINISKNQLKSTGHDELSILSLSTSDYSQFEPLATELMDYCKKENVSLSLPSLRLDTFSFNVLEQIQGYKKSGLTFAPEAGTQRLRDVINKGITEDDIFDAVSQAIELGWRSVKLYFMIGLPTETYDDLDGIADIARKIMEIHRDSSMGGRFNITVSVSNFVPKAHTPFQWAGQNTIDNFRDKHRYLKDKLRIKGVKFNYHDDGVSVIEGILARGDRRVGELLLEAHKLGCKFDGWSEHFSKEKWDKAAVNAGIDGAFFAQRPRYEDEILPWDKIDSGVTKEFLRKEWERAQECLITHDCRYGCVGCGVNRKVECKWGGIYTKDDN